MKRGFTLIEVLITVSLCAVLLAGFSWFNRAVSTSYSASLAKTRALYQACAKLEEMRSQSSPVSDGSVTITPLTHDLSQVTVKYGGLVISTLRSKYP